MDFGGGGGASTPKVDGNYHKCGGNHRKNHHNTANVNQSHRHHHFGRAMVKIVLVFVLIGLTFIFVNKSDNKLVNRPSNNPKQRKRLSPPDPSFDVVEADEFKSEDLSSSYGNDENSLEKTLRRAAMKDHKTVIITTLNAAWTEADSIFDLFLESFRIGDRTQNLLNNLVVVAFDQKAHSRCLDLHLHCFALTVDGDGGGGGGDFSGQASFMSGNYLKMMWKRIDFLRSVLEMGYNFVFSDADIMWLRDPFPRFYTTGDFQIACDTYNRNSTDLGNYPNGGFTYVKSNNRTIEFYKFWYNGKDYFPGKHDQDVFNLIKFDPFISKIGLEIRFLDTAYFGGFCQPAKDLDLVVTMHANCCVGFEKKIHDIKMVIEDWKTYMRNNSGRVSWTVPRECGLKKNKSGN